MKTHKTIISSVILLTSLGALPVNAQDNQQVEQLRIQLKQLQDSFERVQREQQAQIDALKKQLDAAKVNTVVPGQSTAGAAPPTPTTAAPKAVENKPWSATEPITLMRKGGSYMNISFGALMDFGWSTDANPDRRLNLGDHDPIQRGFSMRNAEIAVDGAVDPYFKGQSIFVMKLDKNMETSLELEETFVQSTSLPANLQLKAGQFFANFGRVNTQHPHAWAFVDQPLIINRAFGPDGLRNIGAQMSWLLPTSFFTELSLGIFDGQGGNAFSFRNQGEDDGTGVNRYAGRATLGRGLRGPQDLLFVPRLSSSFDLSDTRTLVVGTSAAFGPNDTGPRSRTEIYGADAYYKWKPETAQQGFPFVSLQSEVLYRRFGAGEDLLAPVPLPSENLHDWGFYGQVLYGFKPRWVAGLRGEYVSGNTGLLDPTDVFRGQRTRISPDVTFYPSEFSKIRLQYNYDRGEFLNVEHSVWLQLEFQLGAHAPHKF